MFSALNLIVPLKFDHLDVLQSSKCVFAQVNSAVEHEGMAHNWLAAEDVPPRRTSLAAALAASIVLATDCHGTTAPPPAHEVDAGQAGRRCYVSGDGWPTGPAHGGN